MEELALSLYALTTSHHQRPMKAPPEPAAIVGPAPVQTLYVGLRELRKAIDRYCREQKRFNEPKPAGGQGASVAEMRRFHFATNAFERDRSRRTDDLGYASPQGRAR